MATYTVTFQVETNHPNEAEFRRTLSRAILLTVHNNLRPAVQITPHTMLITKENS